MSPTMPFSVSPDQPLHWRCTGHLVHIFEVYKTGEVQRAREGAFRGVPADGTYERVIALVFCATLSNRVTTTTPSPMVRSMPPLSSLSVTPTVSAASHGDLPLTEAEELTKVYNIPIANTTPVFRKIFEVISSKSVSFQSFVFFISPRTISPGG
ncbi:hypothetical protein EDB83DRAFT_2445879 [Lactarius deliciosus]|nr:hypothetical protein EDB83DRAFT_2445879 [Lactarius deliciosus]